MRTRKVLRKKLKSRAGESIAETLAALLILSLAMTMLAGSLVSAAKVNRATKDMEVSFTTVDESGNNNLSDPVSETAGIYSAVSRTNTSVAIQVYTTKDDNEYSFY